MKPTKNPRKLTVYVTTEVDEYLINNVKEVRQRKAAIIDLIKLAIDVDEKQLLALEMPSQYKQYHQVFTADQYETYKSTDLYARRMHYAVTKILPNT